VDYVEKLKSTILRGRMILAIPLLLVGVIYSASTPKEFLNWDDPKYILTNPLISGLTLEKLQMLLGQPYFGNYAPIPLLSYAFDIKLWGLNANAFHVHNVLLHLACVIALYFLLTQLELGKWPRYLAVLIFAIHPTNVESISWASERKNLLSALFFLLCFTQYVRYTRMRNGRAYLSSLLFFILSLLSKAEAVGTPLLLVGFDYLVERKPIREIRWLEKAPFFLLAAAHTYLSIHAASHGGSLHSYYDGALWLRLIDSGRLVGHYLALLFWPVGLTPLITPKMVPSMFDLRVLLPFLAGAGILVLWFRLSKQSFFWVAFFLVLLAPVMNIVPLPVVMACRYLYLPQIGVWLLLSKAAEKAWLSLNKRQWLHWGTSFAISFVLLSWAALLVVEARGWAGEWRNSVALWEDALRKDPLNLIARANLGQAYLEKGREKEAAVQFSSVMALQSENILALTGLAMCALSEDNPETAEKYAARVTQLSPDYALGFRLLGRAQLLRRDLPNATRSLVRAYELNPDDNATADDLITVYQFSTHPLDGLFLADRMIQNSPHTYEGHWARARLLLAAGRYGEAITSLDYALRASPGPGSFVGQALTSALAKAKEAQAQQLH
jgi:tetratricopeptide (TPR) repeat protein